ncbi:C40 family peptidase [Cohnella cholangitidis]|uniref:C40 family peptidase n=1 Tax=Cohnella cholangitidis TaxID=2598458 RepID=UPI001E482013|nr:stalk domain-containing protein [Cohnella cholangitidis]
MFVKIGSIALLGLLLCQDARISAAAIAAPDVYIDGKKLEFAARPVVKNGTTLVPMRSIFEAQGAEISWENDTRTVTATKNGTTLTYRIGDTSAYLNKERVPLTQPGTIIGGFSMVPLRFISETMGDLVKWHAYSNEISISSSKVASNTVTYGVNLRVTPAALPDSPIARMVRKGEKIQILREIDANWLEVRTEDDRIGFISAKPLYTDYSSPSLASLQGDELISFGQRYLGTPYEFGADANQTLTFDCSSFVRHVFSEVLSIDLPRVSYDQAKEGKEVQLDQLRKGDLLFFSAAGSTSDT